MGTTGRERRGDRTRRRRTAARLLAPLPADGRLPRLAQLYGGLVAYGVSDSLLVRARLGVDPWDVFQQGLARHTGIAIGTWSVLVGLAVLVLWVPLRQRPGLGTLSNVVLVGATLDVALALVPAPHALWVRIVALLGGVLLNGMATGGYIAAGLGPGPRDGLMVGFAGRGHSLRVVRTAIEATVVLAGWWLGGNLGVGTLLYAAAIGPLAQLFIECFGRGRRAATAAGR